MSGYSEKLQQLFETPAFLDQAATVESVEELQQLFQANGVELTVDQVESLVCAVVQDNSDPSGEISEDDLESVSGGAWKGYVKAFVAGWKTGWGWGKKFSEWEEKIRKKIAG